MIKRLLFAALAYGICGLFGALFLEALWYVATLLDSPEEGFLYFLKISCVLVGGAAAGFMAFCTFMAALTILFDVE